MTPDKRLLFVSSRGVGAVIGFMVDPQNGDLTQPQVSLYYYTQFKQLIASNPIKSYALAPLTKSVSQGTKRPTLG